MTADERLSLIGVKVERARKHLRDLELARDNFINRKPYRLGRESNPATGNNIYRVFDIQIPSAESDLLLEMLSTI